MRKELIEECPVCGAALRGSRFTGYQCGKCGAFFSARHIAHTRRQLFSELVTKHFPEKTILQEISSGPPKKQAAIERVDVIIEDKAGKIERALKEAKESARIASRHLEDVLTRVKELPDPAEVEAAIRIEENKIIIDSPSRKPVSASKPRVTSKSGITRTVVSERKVVSKKTKKPHSKKSAKKTTTAKAKKIQKTASPKRSRKR